MLFSHYWSYIRYPHTPTVHLPDLGERSAPEKEQVAFSSAFRDKIEYVQAQATATNGVYLTFRPIGKNLRLLGTALRANVDRNRMTYIRRGGPPTEEYAVSLKGRQWNPWLWGRVADYQVQTHGPNRDTAKAWNGYFKHPAINANGEGPHCRPQIPKLRLAYGPFSTSYLERVLKIAVATKYVFSPVDSILSQVESLKQKMQWPGSDEQVLGIHVRRGDAATNSTDANQKSTRTSFPLAAYLDAADAVCNKYKIRYIFIASESGEEIDLAKRLRPQYKFLCLAHDRSIFPSIAVSDQFMEYLAFDHPERIPALAMSAILDLHFLSQCHAFIGAFNSQFSMLGWLLAVGTRSHVVPYVSLSQPTKQGSLNVVERLLDVRHNCPLELYHW